MRLGEPYRTMLGHFRHEVGHYYQNILVETGPGAQRYLDECRACSATNAPATPTRSRGTTSSARPRAGSASFISEYATMHPWEDFAECFAHYLHITDTIDTAREAGMVLHADRVRFAPSATWRRWSPTTTHPIERLLYDWKWMSTFFNRINTSMGKPPLYPFETPAAGGRQTGLRAQGRA